MIPYILHFIWIGKKPKYVNFVIDAYKNINPHCKINFVSFSEKHFEEIYFKHKINNENEQLVFETLNDIFNQLKYKKLIKILLTGQQHMNLSTTPFLQIFADIYRLALLNKYGGLYIDCDTYPIKKFDNFIFNNKRLCVLDKINENVYILNNYFLGAIPNTDWQNYFDKSAKNIILENNQQFTKINAIKSFDFIVRRIKFFKQKLSLNDFKNVNNNDYFEHYSEFRWGQNKINLTKFDQIFNRKIYFDYDR